METETIKPIGALLPGIVTTETVTPAPSTNELNELNLDKLPKVLDDQTLALVTRLANSPLPASENCDEAHFAKCFRSIAILPRRADDGLTGKLRDGLYWAKLKGYSDAALSYLVSTALERCHWFPSIAECIEILKAWPNREIGSRRQGKARVIVQNELQRRMDETLAVLRRREMAQPQIDELAERLKRIAAEKGYLWGWPDGRFTIRYDLDKLDPEDRDAERERIRAMFEEWDRIKVAQAEGDSARD